jgi:uncharacterized membrane protein (UPF0127 family)
MKTSLKFLILGVAIFILTLVFTNLLINRPKNKVCFGSDCFFVKLAKTDAEREKGLMFQKSLDKNSGMLFVFPAEGIYPFWMKNTLVSLDIIWIDGNKKVVFIKENAQPCQPGEECPLIYPEAAAQYVLEINAGLSPKNNIKIGDTADF